jgi:hypothetical protein
VVHEDPATGYLQVNYTELLPVVVEAFKELLMEFRDEKEEVRSQLQSLKTRLDAITIDLENGK